MAPDVQTVSIYDYLPSHETREAVFRLLYFMIVGGLAGYLLAIWPLRIRDYMARSWYKKQKRYFAIQNREDFVKSSVVFAARGRMPNVYHTAADTFWVPKHYHVIAVHFLRWHGTVQTEELLGKLPEMWWRRLDDSVPHIMTLAMLDDDGITLREWLIEVNPHDALWTLPAFARPRPF